MAYTSSRPSDIIPVIDLSAQKSILLGSATPLTTSELKNLLNSIRNNPATISEVLDRIRGVTLKSLLAQLKTNLHSSIESLIAQIKSGTISKKDELINLLTARLTEVVGNRSVLSGLTLNQLLALAEQVKNNDKTYSSSHSVVVYNGNSVVINNDILEEVSSTLDALAKLDSTVQTSVSDPNGKQSYLGTLATTAGSMGSTDALATLIAQADGDRSVELAIVKSAASTAVQNSQINFLQAMLDDPAFGLSVQDLLGINPNVVTDIISQYQFDVSDETPLARATALYDLLQLLGGTDTLKWYEMYRGTTIAYNLELLAKISNDAYDLLMLLPESTCVIRPGLMVAKTYQTSTVGKLISSMYPKLYLRGITA